MTAENLYFEPIYYITYQIYEQNEHDILLHKSNNPSNFENLSLRKFVFPSHQMSLWFFVWIRVVPANSGALCKTMDWGPSSLVQDHEYQGIAAGKHDVLCESTNVTSHTCDCQLNHHRRSNNCFFVPEEFFLLLEQFLLFEQQNFFPKKVCFSNKALRGLVY